MGTSRAADSTESHPSCLAHAAREWLSRTLGQERGHVVRLPQRPPSLTPLGAAWPEATRCRSVPDGVSGSQPRELPRMTIPCEPASGAAGLLLRPRAAASGREVRGTHSCTRGEGGSPGKSFHRACGDPETVQGEGAEGEGDSQVRLIEPGASKRAESGV